MDTSKVEQPVEEVYSPLILGTANSDQSPPRPRSEKMDEEGIAKAPELSEQDQQAIDRLDLHGYTTTKRGKPLHLTLYQAEKDFLPPDLDGELFWRPLTFLFYGTLQEPTILTMMTEVEEPHDYRPARIENLQIKEWFANVIPVAEAKEGAVLEGLAWKCPNPHALSGLLRYEGPGYKLERRRIIMDDGEVVEDGRVFVGVDDAHNSVDLEWS
ncbi:hypothetical protein SCARD494_08365 [Seiridium cardinale]